MSLPALHVLSPEQAAQLDNILQRGRLTRCTPQQVRGMVARHVASSLRLSGHEVTAAEIEQILERAPNTSQEEHP